MAKLVTLVILRVWKNKMKKQTIHKGERNYYFILKKNEKGYEIDGMDIQKKLSTLIPQKS